MASASIGSKAWAPLAATSANEPPIRRHDRATAGHGFKHWQAEAFVQRGHDEQFSIAKSCCQIANRKISHPTNIQPKRSASLGNGVKPVVRTIHYGLKGDARFLAPK